MTGSPANAGTAGDAAAPDLGLLRQLADGGVHPVAALAAVAGLDAAGLQRRLDELSGQGWRLARQPDGVRLLNPLAMLDAAAIRAALPAETLEHLADIALHATVDSTNAALLRRAASSPIHGAVHLAEYQAAGRGRRGNAWLAPAGAAVCLSVGWEIKTLQAAVNRFSVMLGIEIARALRAAGISEAGVKWPNDIVLPDGKLGGILVELQELQRGGIAIVTGIGLNVRLPASLRAGIEQPVTDLETALRRPPDRNALAALAIDATVRTLRAVSADAHGGLADWDEFDTLLGRRVRIEATGPGDEDAQEGVAAGIDASGALRLRQGATCRSIMAGHVVPLDRPEPGAGG